MDLDHHGLEIIFTSDNSNSNGQNNILFTNKDL